MCVGHPKRHPCQHTSVSFNHCVSAHFDPNTSITTPCQNTTYAAPIDTSSSCTNQLCYFDELGGSWVCCTCRQGPNTVGWCTYDRPRTEVSLVTGQLEQLRGCDHCCCWNCTPYADGSSCQGSSKHKKSKRGGAAGGGGDSSAQSYRWIEMKYGQSKGGSSSSKKKKK